MIFYRVGNTNTNNQGLWYAPDGTFTGHIHGKFNFVKNHDLKMPFDPQIVGWLSATKTLEDLYYWFTKEDISKLREHGFSVLKYESEDYKIHGNHWVIKQETAKLIEVM